VPEAWTTSLRSKISVKSSETIRLNPYSGETMVLGRTDILRSPQKVGIPEVSTTKAKFNIFNLKPSIVEESALSVKTPSASDITSLYFEKQAGTTKISSGAYRDIAKPGRGTLYKGYADELGYLGESKKTREITSAISDLLKSETPEYGVKLSKYGNVPTPRVKFAENKLPKTPTNPIGLGVEPLYETRAAGIPRATIRDVTKEPIPSKGFSTTGQQLKYAEVSPVEKMGATWKSIFGELSKAKPKQKYSSEGAMVSARVEQMMTRARRSEQLPEETRRFEELQKVTPSLKSVGPIIDTSEYVKYSEAMLKGLKGGEVKVGVSLKSTPIISAYPNRIERQYGRIDKIGVGIGEITSSSQRSLQKQTGEQTQPTIEKESASAKSMSETIQKSMQDILKTTSQLPAEETMQKQEEIAIKIPSIVTTLIPADITTQLPRQTPVTDTASISKVGTIQDITQIPDITTKPPKEPKIKIPVIPLLFGGSLSGGGGGGAGPRKRYKKHTEVFEYNFTPALAAVAVTKALRRGSNVTRGPGSSLPSFSLQKPTQKLVKVVPAQRPVQQKVASIQMPSFSMPNIGIAKKSSSTTGIRSISLPSSLPQKKKRK
jgi:hypothetical protein